MPSQTYSCDELTRLDHSNQNQNSMANLLMKLRIEYSSLTMLQGVTDPPKQETIDMHSKLLQHFTDSDGTQIPISEHERMALQDKTRRQLRLREMLLEHSNEANLIVMSMPMPRLVKKRTCLQEDKFL